MIIVVLYTAFVVFAILLGVFGLYKNDWKTVEGPVTTNPGFTFGFVVVFSAIIHFLLYLAVGPVWPVFAGIAWSLWSVCYMYYQYTKYGHTRTTLPSFAASLPVTLFILMGYWTFI